MTQKEVYEIIKSAGFPTAYHHFEEGEAPEAPFVVYLLPSSNNFAADNSVFAHIQNLHVELYTDKKDLDAETRMEKVLDRIGFWQKSETWIASEKLYEILYELEVIINV